MNFLQKNKVVFFALAVIISLTSCFDRPNEFVAPTWDTELNIPITKKEFKLLEIVEKDSSLLKSYENPETMGLIYFGDTQAVAAIRIEDELKIDPFETTLSHSIGLIEIKPPLPAYTHINVEDWATDITPGETQIFPEQVGDVTLGITGVSSVESIFADYAKLTINVYNNLPVDIVLRGIHINNIDGSHIADTNAWFTILSDTNLANPTPFPIEFPILGKRITDSLQYLGTIWSGGSNGNLVEIPFGAGTTILALFEDLVISEATAPLPSQEFQFNKVILVDDSTKIEEGIISEGRMVLTANNNIDVDLTATASFDNIFNTTGDKYSLNIPLARNEQNKIVEISSLNNWKIATTSPGVPTNEITYRIEVVTDSTGEVSNISKNDSVAFNISFHELALETFKGILKPTMIDLNESGFKIDYGDFNKQLKFGEINFKDAKFNLNFSSSADMNLLVNGDLFASNGQTSNSQPTGDIIIPSDDPIQIDISNLINGFSSVLPDTFKMVGSALLNSDYQVGSVSQGDSVYGTIDFEIPLNVGIAQGSFIDTLEFDLGDVDRDDINRLNYGDVTFTILNSMPVELRFTAIVLDSNYNSVLSIPTNYSNIDTIRIDAPEVSETGDIISASEKIQTIALVGDDIKEFLQNPYLAIEVKFWTAGDALPVKFKTSNKISFDIRVKADYRVEL